MKKNKLLVFLLAAVSTTAIAAAGCSPQAGGHNHSYGWKSDADNHWEECSCGNKKAQKPHVDAVNNETGAQGADGKCDDCGRLSYAVTFNVQGHGAAPDTQYVYEGGKAANPGLVTEPGFIFGGWYADADCTVEFDFDSPINTATPVYAKWSVSVTFDTHGHGTEPEEQTVKVGGTVTPPTDPDYGADGYVFGGWTLDNSGAADATPYDFSTPVSEAITLYAIWVADTRPLVTFNLGADGDNAVYSLLRVEEGGCATKPAVDPDIDGYLFAGWYTVDGDEPFDFENTPINGDITLYAHWTKDERTMFIFDLQGHGDTIPTQKLREGEKPNRPADPSADGYTFAGWYANPECDGDEYDFDSELDGDTTVYAKWTVTVKFDVQGHGTAPDAQTVKDGGLVEDPGDLANDGEYVFGGWYKDASCTEEFDFDSDTVDAATTIYAKWTHVVPDLVLNDDTTSVIGDRTELRFKYTATRDGRFRLELATGASYNKCTFTTDLAEDDGVTYGAGCDYDSKLFDLHKGETVTVTLHRGADIADTLALGFYFTQILDEALPSDGWISGKYVGGGYTIDFDRDQKEITYKDWGYTGYYLGGSFDYLWFIYEQKPASFLSRSVKVGNVTKTIYIDEDGNDLANQDDIDARVQTYRITEYYIRETSVGVWELSSYSYSSHYESHGFGQAPSGPTKLATLNYEEPQREIAVSEFAGTYEGTGFYAGSQVVDKAVIYEDGSGYFQYGDTKLPPYQMGDGGVSFERSESTLKWGNTHITANLGEDDNVVSINIVDTINGGGIFVYTRTGDVPVELPKELPVDEFVNYAGQHFLYTRKGSDSHSVFVDTDYYGDPLDTFKITEYNSSTDRYVINYAYYDKSYKKYEVTVEAKVNGSAGNYTIEIYENKGTKEAPNYVLYDTLTPLVYHTITPNVEETINVSDFVVGKAYYFKAPEGGNYTIRLGAGEEGNYKFTTTGNGKDNIHIHTEVNTGNLASFECTMGCLGDGAQVRLSEGQVIAIHIGQTAVKPQTIKVKFEKEAAAAGDGSSEANAKPIELGGVWTFTANPSDVFYAKFTASAEGDYKIRFSHKEWGDDTYKDIFYLNNRRYGVDENNTYMWYYDDAVDDDWTMPNNDYWATIHLTAGQTLIIKLVCHPWNDPSINYKLEVSQ